MSGNNNSTLTTWITAFAFSAIAMTSTTDYNVLNDLNQKSSLIEKYSNYGTTNTLRTLCYEFPKVNYFEESVNLFNVEMRDFTEEEAKVYSSALNSIYKGIGVNIFELC